MIYVNGIPLEEYMRLEGMSDEELASILEDALNRRIQATKKLKEAAAASAMSDLTLSLYSHYSTIPDELPCDGKQASREQYVLTVYNDIIKERKGNSQLEGDDVKINKIKGYLQEKNIHPDIAYLICNVHESYIEQTLEMMQKWRDTIANAGGLVVDKHTFDRKTTRFLIRKSMQDKTRTEYCSIKIPGLHDNAVLAYILLDEFI